MSRRRLFFALLGAACLVILLGCTGKKTAVVSPTAPNGPDATAVLNQAFAKFQSLKSFHVSVTSTSRSAGQSQTQVQEMDLVLPRTAYAVTTVNGTTFELVLDGTSAFVRLPGRGWQSLEDLAGVSLRDFGFTEQSFTAGFDYSKSVSSARFGNEVIGRTRVTNILVELDVDALIAQLIGALDPSSPLVAIYRTARDASGSGQYSIDRASGNIVESHFDMSFKLAGSTFESTVDARYSAIDEPVKFPDDSPVTSPR